jgi:hypothetical protein
MEKNYEKSGKKIHKMIELIAKIEVNIQWSKKAHFEDMKEKYFNETVEQIKELSNEIINIVYVEGD